METMMVPLGIFSLISVCVNVWLILRPAPKRHDSTAKDLLHDLTRRGNAILRVEVIDPENLILRSPR
jgi:hypothetical protein